MSSGTSGSRRGDADRVVSKATRPSCGPGDNGERLRRENDTLTCEHAQRRNELV